MILSQFWTQIQVFARDLNGYDVIDPSTIEIYVTDINDNFPIFDQESYVGQVAEHSPPGTLPPPQTFLANRWKTPVTILKNNIDNDYSIIWDLSRDNIESHDVHVLWSVI